MYTVKQKQQRNYNCKAEPFVGVTGLAFFSLRTSASKANDDNNKNISGVCHFSAIFNILCPSHHTSFTTNAAYYPEIEASRLQIVKKKKKADCQN